jgi:hypothetical protein
MPAVGFKPTISAGERLQTYALDRVATGTGNTVLICIKYSLVFIIIRLELESNVSEKRSFFLIWADTDIDPDV